MDKRALRVEEGTEAVKEKRRKITSMLNAVDADHCAARTWVEIMMMLEELEGVTVAGDDERLENPPSPDEDRTAFEAMVKRVRIEEEDHDPPQII